MLLVGLLLAAGAAGCTAGVAEPGDGAGDPATAAETESFEQIVIDDAVYPAGERSVYSPDFSPAAAEGGASGEGPCSCESPECLQEWADVNLGCDVCVSTICDGEPGPHVCNSCSDPE